jgi:hypothetical protein
MSKEFAVPPAIRKYFKVRAGNTKAEGLHRVIECKVCRASWRYQWKPWTAGTQLHLLNHAYGHDVPQPKEETVPAYNS